MFHGKVITENDNLTSAWKSAHNLIPAESKDKTNLLPLCRTLDVWVDSQHHSKRKRLSLSTSSKLINGTVRLYQMQLASLYKDVINLEEGLITKNFHRNEDITVSLNSTEELGDKLNMTLKSSDSNSSSKIITSKSKSRTLYTSEEPYKRFDDSQSNSTDDESNLTESGESSNITNSRTGESKDPDEATQKVDVGIQTSTPAEESRTFCPEGNEDTPPVGFTIIYDQNCSKNTFTVIRSFINANVRNI